MSDTINNNTKQFLDKVGLAALWDKICVTIGIAVDKYIPETVNITYNELVELRNSHALKPGEKYRITDYVTTVNSNQLDVISGNHRFDIIVEALDNCTLSEQAKAVRHEDDWYFESENLEAWQLWYCLDNDKKRFEWADDGVVDYKAEFIGAYTVDPAGNNKGEYHIDKDYAIYEWEILSHPDTGDDCIVLYTQDPMYYSEGGADYTDIYFYDGIVTVDGQEYDSWRKYNDAVGDWVSLHQYTNPDTGEIEYFEYYYLLTERIVFGDEVIWPELPNTSNGKGVIYRMIDEYGNDCPYDFKNIKYYCEGMGTHVYTFTWVDEEYNVIDTSVFGNNGVLTYFGEINGVHNNVIKPYYATDYDIPDESTGIALCKQFLNNITFISDYIGSEGFWGCYSNSFGNDCYNNHFGNDCYFNVFGNDCYFNVFGSNCYNNSLYSDCHDNIFGNECNDSIIYTSCYFNRVGNGCRQTCIDGNCYSNILGDRCDSISLGSNCRYNVFGNGCYSNHIRNNCYFNSFGNGCGNNTLENECYENSLGNGCFENYLDSYCQSNSFGNSCHKNRLGKFCDGNNFGNNCSYNGFYVTANISGALCSSCNNNRFDDGCSLNILHGESQTGNFHNLHIVRGVSGTGNDYNYINVAVSENATYEIKVAKNSNGEIKVYCEADLIA